MNVTQKAAWPWEQRSLSTERRSRIFNDWTVFALEALEAPTARELSIEAEREADPTYTHAASTSLGRQLARGKKLLKCEAAVKRMLSEKDKTAFMTLTRDPDVAHYIAGVIFRPQGREKGEHRRTQRNFKQDERDMLKDLAADAATIKRVWRRHGIKRKMDDGLPREDEIAISRYIPKGLSLGERERILHLWVRDLANFRKGRRATKST